MTYLTSAELAGLKAKAKADLADDFTHQEISIATILRLIDMVERRDEWQPLETAPKDGRFILLHVPHGLESGAVTVGAYWKEEDRKAGRFMKGHWDGWLGMDADIASSWCEPTHWQPLPAPPREALAATEPKK